MKRILAGLAITLAALALLLAAESYRERTRQHRTDLRVFDAPAVARLETQMWRSYYERRPLRLFRQMIDLLRTQYQMPPLMAVQNSYRAAHAAFVFKDGHSRTDYERAMPDLERYYNDLAALAAQPFDASRAARLELEWWIVHRDSPNNLPAALAALQAEIYGLPAETFATHAARRAEAMKLRDRKATAITDADWQRIGDMLRRSWESLQQAVQ